MIAVHVGYVLMNYGLTTLSVQHTFQDGTYKTIVNKHVTSKQSSTDMYSLTVDLVYASSITAEGDAEGDCNYQQDDQDDTDHCQKHPKRNNNCLGVFCGGYWYVSGAVA